MDKAENIIMAGVVTFAWVIVSITILPFGVLFSPAIYMFWAVILTEQKIY